MTQNAAADILGDLRAALRYAGASSLLTCGWILQKSGLWCAER